MISGSKGRGEKHLRRRTFEHDADLPKPPAFLTRVTKTGSWPPYNQKRKYVKKIQNRNTKQKYKTERNAKPGD